MKSRVTLPIYLYLPFTFRKEIFNYKNCSKNKRIWIGGLYGVRFIRFNEECGYTSHFVKV